MNKKSTVYLPIETKSREYLAKLLLGCFLTEENDVYIGERTKMRNRMGIMPCGIFIEKGIGFAGDKWMFEFLNRHQHLICGWEEEGFMFDRDRFKLNFGKKSFLMLEYFFCWGEYIFNTIKSMDDKYVEKMIKSGNPRFDLLDRRIRGHLYKNENINDKPYILFNTNFSLSNNIDTTDALKDIMIPHYINNNENCSEVERQRQINYFKEIIENNKKNFKDFADLARYLSAIYHEFDIIIRPHPSENINNWKEQVKGYDNIKIIHNRTSNEWSYNAIAVIHTNCTTGVEAYMMEKPVIAYLKNEKTGIGFDLANSLSLKTYNEEDVVKILNSVLSGEEIVMKTPEREALLHQYYYSNDYLASELITDKIKSLHHKIKRRTLIQKIDGIYSYFHYGLKQQLLRLFRIIPWVNTYFPGLTLDEIKDDINKYSNYDLMFDSIKVTKVTGNIFKLTR